MRKINNKTNLPTNKMETMLFSLPKNCDCSTCKNIKKHIKNEIGDLKYKSICQEVGIILY